MSKTADIKYIILVFFSFCAGLSTMVQMGAKTTTITESDMLQQEMDLLKNVQKEKKSTSYDGDQLQFDAVSEREIIWKNVVFIALLHVMAVYCFCIYFFTTKSLTYFWGKYNLHVMI